mmetsp:Transcript_26849/g.65161  ORF Transcript_26849/g.65161 Transcript_26849/m.65161 type:complete len:191 (-) Transcript_26849:671-1243(-)
MALLWRLMLEHSSENDAYILDATSYCEQAGESVFREGAVDEDPATRRACELVKIAGFLDVQDEIGKQAINTAMGNICSSERVPNSVIPDAVQILRRVSHSTTLFVNATLAGEVQEKGSEGKEASAAPSERILLLINEMLKNPKVTVKHAGILELLPATVLPMIANTDPQIRNRALEALGLMCLLDRSVAE